jgi:hypothetical protein
MDFDSKELAAMIHIGGVNRIFLFSLALREHLENARAGAPPDLLRLLKQARQVTYGGMSFAKELEDWAVSQAVPLVVSTTFLFAGPILLTNRTE